MCLKCLVSKPGLTLHKQGPIQVRMHASALIDRVDSRTVDELRP